MDIRQLKVLRTMLRVGSVSETARIINISQPAVSKTLAGIEAELQMRLFERINGRVVPTINAHALGPEIDRVLGDFSNFYQTARELREGSQGHVRIASVATIAASVLPPAIGLFKQSNPRIDFTVTIGATAEVVGMVERNQVDIGLCQPPTDDADVRRTELCKGSVVCVMPDGHPLGQLRQVGPTELAGIDLIGLGVNEPTGARIADAFRNAGARYRVAVEINQKVMACTLVAAGLGLALVDSFLVAETLFPSLVSRPFAPEIQLRVEVMTSNHRALGPVAHAFFDLLTSGAALPAGRR